MWNKTTAADGGELLKALHPWLALTILNGWLVVSIGSKATVNQVWIFFLLFHMESAERRIASAMLDSLHKGTAVSPAAGTASIGLRQNSCRREALWDAEDVLAGLIFEHGSRAKVQ